MTDGQKIIRNIACTLLTELTLKLRAGDKQSFEAAQLNDTLNIIFPLEKTLCTTRHA